MKLFFFLLLLSSIHLSCAGIRPSVPGGPEYRILEAEFPAADGEILPYRLLVPGQKNANEHLPLLVTLHGAGVKIESMIDSWQESALDHRVMVLAPQWSHLKSRDRRPAAVLDLTEMIVRDYSVDTERIYLSGDSAGAFVARKVLDLRPEWWRGCIFVASPTSKNDPWFREVEDGTALPPILFVHGEQDSSFPYELLSNDVEELRRKGADVEMISDPEAGHTHKKEWNEPIFGWMERKTD